MKKNKILLLITFLLSITSFAQANLEEKKEQVKALKVSFITTELALTAEEAARFWPVYNEYDNRQFQIRHKKMKYIIEKLKDDSLEKMSESEASKLMAYMEINEDELYKNQKKFMKNVKEILPPIKILKLKKAEVEFYGKLLKQYGKKDSKK